jgi:hypothetical protein
MGSLMNRKAWVVSAAAVVAAAMLVSFAEARPYRGRSNANKDNFYTPQTDDWGKEVVPNFMTDPDRYAHYVIWTREVERPRKHRLTLAESLLKPEEFKTHDKNGDGFLDLAEVTAYVKELREQALAKAGGKDAKDTKDAKPTGDGDSKKKK